jgi:hypothetical protein
MMVEHGDLLDWYVDGDESAVFVEGQVMVLSALATAVLDIVGPDGQASLEQIGEELVTRFGDPGEPVESVVLSKVTELIENGVLREVPAT